MPAPGDRAIPGARAGQSRCAANQRRRDEFERPRIAETGDLPTKFARIVVTDDQGRYLVPDLPSANYQVFVRGYGLLDSPRQAAKPGQQLNVKVGIAPDARSAAQVYPAAWWLSMLTLPDDKEFQRKFPMDMKDCFDCHQVGTKTTREIGPNSAPGAASTLEAWDRRTRAGPSGPSMGSFFQAIGEQRKIFADWVDRIAKGEASKLAPPRPTGIERNLVITEWDWGTPTDGRSDNAASDTRDARVNANGLVYGASEMTDSLSTLVHRFHETDHMRRIHIFRRPRSSILGPASPTKPLDMIRTCNGN